MVALPVVFLLGCACEYGITIEGDTFTDIEHDPGAVSDGLDISEVPATTWARTYGTARNDRGYAISQMPDGGYVVAGTIEDEDTGDRFGWILRLDHEGTILWHTSLDHEAGIQVFDAVPYPGGDIIAAGKLDGWYGSESGILIFKLDLSGALVWSSLLVDVMSLSPIVSLVQVAGGGSALSSSGIVTSGETGILVARFDPGGTVLWVKLLRYPDPYFDMKTRITATSDGGFVLAGIGQVSDWMNEQYRVIKLDEHGEIEWQKEYGGVWTEETNSSPGIVQTRDGRYLVATNFQMGSGYSGSLLAMLDGTGNLEWSRAYDAEDWCGHGASDLSAVDDGFVLSARYRGGEIWVMRLDRSGEPVWQRRYGARMTDDVAESVKPTSDGGFIVAGRTDSWGAIAGDIWVLKLDRDGVISSGCPEGVGEVGVIRQLDAPLTELGTALTLRAVTLDVTTPDLTVVHQEARVETQCSR